MTESRSVLITGATGKIGRHLCSTLGDDFSIRSGVRRPVNDLPHPVQCQIRDFDSVRVAMEGADAVIHLAAQTWDHDVRSEMIPDNIIGTYNIFEAARCCNVSRVIFASSNHLMGGYHNEGICVTEDMPPRPDSFYAVTKIYGESLGRLYAEKHGLSVICTRIGWFRDLATPPATEREKEWRQRFFRRTVAKSMWISGRDMTQFIRRCLTVENIMYEVLNCCSNNTGALFDLTRARTVLGYEPRDDIAQFSR